MGVRTASVIQRPQQELLRELTEMFGDAAGDLISSITGIGGSIADIKKSFMEDFATPAMELWNREVAPGIKEGFNLPGSFYGSSRFSGEQREQEEFLSGRVNPVLFQALENFRDREVSKAGVFANVLNIGTGLSTAQTMQAFIQQNRDWQAKTQDIQQTVSGYISSWYNPGQVGR